MDNTSSGISIEVEFGKKSSKGGRLNLVALGLRQRHGHQWKSYFGEEI
jgi:hypothetical protein